MGWPDDLSSDDRDAWDGFVEHFRRDALEKIGGSAAFVSLLPHDDFDVQFAAELGTAIMLNKPIIVVRMPGVAVPPALQAIAAKLVDADVDTEAGRAALTDAFGAVLKQVTE